MYKELKEAREALKHWAPHAEPLSNCSSISRDCWEEGRLRSPCLELLTGLCQRYRNLPTTSSLSHILFFIHDGLSILTEPHAPASLFQSL